MLVSLLLLHLFCLVTILSFLQSKETMNSSSTIWISMSTCMSASAPHKAHYSYQAGAVLATFLWVNLVNAKVIVTLVAEETDDDDEIKYLQNVLTKMGAVVNIMKKEEDIGCVLMAQTARMLAFNLPMVSDNDIIMMADTDMFPTDQGFLDPLYHNYQVWVYWWEAVVFLNESFPMSMLAMEAKTWSRLLNYSTSVRELSKLPGSRQRVFTVQGDTMDTWEVDQSVTTTAILKSGLCSAPGNSSLWTKLGLKPENHNYSGENTERATCWHGQGWGQCRASLGMQYYPGIPGCTWWHALLPREFLEQVVPTTSPLYRLVHDHGLLFESDARLTQISDGKNFKKLSEFGFYK